MYAKSSDNASPATEVQGGPSLAPPEALTRLCAETTPSQGGAALIDGIACLMPDLEFRAVLCRGGWHRLGGVVDSGYRRIAGNIRQWVEQECEDAIDELVFRYAESGYFATRISGKTHYITAACGDQPQDFIQVEIEELQETLDRPLLDPDWFPDSTEEFLEPIDYPRVEPEPLGAPYYQFRRITSIGDLLGSAAPSRKIDNLRRFFADWSASSAGDAATFCDHWVLALSEYRDRDGLGQLTVKPIATLSDDTPDLPRDGRVHGSVLANAIHAYDRRVGYPFAWYFMMLGQKAANFSLADAVLADQMGAYEYLPARDLKVLRAWEQRGYGV